MRSFYQGRLGTNIGKVEEKHVSAGVGAGGEYVNVILSRLH